MKCPSCGAALPTEELDCARCGAHVGWWIKLRTGHEKGPFTFLEIQPMVRQGQIGAFDRVRVGLIGEWIPAPELLSPTFGQGAPPPTDAPERPPKRKPIVRLRVIVALTLGSLAVVAIAFGMHRLAQSPEVVSPREMCSTNIRLLTRGIALYCDDYDDRLPDWGDWPDVTHPYVHSREAYICPGGRPGERGYDYNAALGRIRRGQVPDPRECILIWDAGALGPSSGIHGGYGPPRHDGGDNYGHLDGRVSWRARGALPGMTPVTPDAVP